MVDSVRLTSAANVRVVLLLWLWLLWSLLSVDISCCSTDERAAPTAVKDDDAERALLLLLLVSSNCAEPPRALRILLLQAATGVGGC